jgi:hypothetical protein
MVIKNVRYLVLGILVFFMVERVSDAAPGQTFGVQRGGTVTPWMQLASSPTVYGLVGTAVATPIRVRVTDQNGNVLRDSRGVPIRLSTNFRIVEFPAGATGQRLTPGNATSITVLTNNTGYASATLVLGNRNGVYRVAITERATYYTIDRVRALTPAVTASLQFARVDTTTRTANGADVSTVTVRARDYQGNLVTGAQIRLGTSVARDHRQVFSTTAGPGGLYTGRITSTVAGKLALTAWDTATNAKSQATSSPRFIAGPTVRMDIYAVDGPGGAVPVTHVLVFALALDAFGNKVGPPFANVRFTTDFGSVLSTQTVANEWAAWVYSATAGTANVTATDRITGRSNVRPVVFPGSGGSISPAQSQTVIPYKNHHIKFWKPKGTNVDALIAGEILGKRIVYGVKSPALGGPNIYITYAVNEYDFSKADKNSDGILDAFTDSNNPTNEERNLLRNCAASVENVFIVPGTSDNCYGETIGRNAVVINQGAKGPAGKAPPTPDGKTLAHENTHYWDLNAGNHTDGGVALPPDNIGAADPGTASLKCTNKDILNKNQLEKLRNLFPQATRQGVGANPVYPGSMNNRINFTFTNYTSLGAPFAPMNAVRASVVHSSPTAVLYFRPATIALTPSNLGPGQSGTATFLFDISPTAVVGTESVIELAVTCGTGEAFYFPLPFAIVAPPAAGRHWQFY